MFILTDTANAGDVGLQKIPCYWLGFSFSSRAPCFMRYLGNKAVLNAVDLRKRASFLSCSFPKSKRRWRVIVSSLHCLKMDFIPLATGVSGPQWTSGAVFTQLPWHEELVFVGGWLRVLSRPDALRTLSPQVPAHERECENMNRDHTEEQRGENTKLPTVCKAKAFLQDPSISACT